jgi:hypothetical protein
MTGDTDDLAEIKTIGAVLSHYPINGSNLLRNSRPAADGPQTPTAPATGGGPSRHVPKSSLEIQLRP